MGTSIREQLARQALGIATVHWLRRVPGGPIKSGDVVHPTFGKLISGTETECACKPGEVVVFDKFNAASAEPHAVDCPDCIAHPDFAASYYTAPSVKHYEQIPAAHRAAIEKAGR